MTLFSRTRAIFSQLLELLGNVIHAEKKTNYDVPLPLFFPSTHPQPILSRFFSSWFSGSQKAFDERDLLALFIPFNWLRINLCQLGSTKV